MTKRERIFKIIEKAEDGDTASAVFDRFLIILISLNIIAVITSSFNNINDKYSGLFSTFEFISVFIFTIEYLLRIWTAPYKFPPTKKWPVFFSYIRFVFSFMGIVDLCAILPFYLPFVFIDLRILNNQNKLC